MTRINNIKIVEWNDNNKTSSSGLCVGGRYKIYSFSGYGWFCIVVGRGWLVSSFVSLQTIYNNVDVTNLSLPYSMRDIIRLDK